MTARSLAYDLLIKAEKNKIYSNIALDKALDGSELSDVDKRLVSVLFYGVTEKKITLDYRISQLSDRKVEELDTNVLTALRLGLYQLIFLSRIPEHAAVNETVSLCTRKTSGFVNAILRSHLRKGEFQFPSATDDPLKYLSVKYSVCEELADKFIGIFGLEEAENILAGYENDHKTAIRVNTLKVSKAELFENTKGEIIDTVPFGLYVSGSIRDIYGFSDGAFFVQDPASQIAVAVLDAKPYETVLDICSCPGSKSFGAAIDMENKGKIMSFDLHENKLSLIRDGADRLGINIIEPYAHDGRILMKELCRSADKVICDVPCSGFGVIAKKPELRYKSPKESERLPQIQLDILNTASQYVKTGGVLVYSTCTVFPEENQNNISVFLDNHPEFSLCPWEVCGIRSQSGMLTLYPHINGTDGFFIAKLLRNS